MLCIHLVTLLSMVSPACISSKCFASVLSIGLWFDPVYLVRYRKMSGEKEFSVEELSL